MEYRCVSRNVQAAKTFVTALQCTYLGIGVMLASRAQSFWIVGPADISKNAIKRIQTYSKEVEIMEQSRLITNAFEIELDAKLISKLSGVYKAFKEIKSTWSVLLENGSTTPKLADNGTFTLHVYGQNAIKALELVSQHIDAGIWSRLARHYLVFPKPVGTIPNFRQIAKENNVKLFEFNTKSEFLMLMVYGALEDVTEAVGDVKRYLLQKTPLFPSSF